MMLRKTEYFELLVLFFIQGAGMSAWFVPLGSNRLELEFKSVGWNLFQPATERAGRTS